MTSPLPQTPRTQRPARSAKITPLAPRATAVAAAALCLLGANVQALELGRADVRSAIGDRLLAEIVVSGASERELAGLQASLAGADAYRAAGLSQDAAVVGAAVRVVRRGDGRHVLRVEGVRRVEEPFVDLIVQANTDSGRLVRIYTLLLDPKRAEAEALAATAPPSLPRAADTMAAAAPAAPPVRPERSERAAERPPERAAPERKPRPAPPPAAAPAPRAADAATGTRRADQVRVRPGDSLSGIAARTRHANTNTDQMLVALYRNNPDAFIAGNADRLLAGALLAVPDAQTAAAIPRDEARARIVAQRAGTRDALGEPVSRAAAAPREGKPARLELSDGAVVIAKRDTSAPTPALNLPSVPSPSASAPTTPAKPAQPTAAPAPAPAASPVAAPAPVPATAAAPATPGPVGPASAAGVAAAPVATVVAAATPSVDTGTAPPVSPASAIGGSTQAAAGTGTVVAAATPQSVTGPGITRPGSLPPQEPGAFGWLLANPMVLLVGNLLLAALLVFSLWRLRSSKPERPARARVPAPSAAPKVALPEPPAVDLVRPRAPALPALTVASAAAATTATAATVSDAAGKAYSFDEIDTGATIDPLAEAEVYLNYGRDLQAEEILKDALRATPERLPIRLKLLEVYVKRRDRLGFQLLAIQIYSLTGGSGADWEHVQAMGQQLDPEDPLYQPGGQPPGLKKGEDEHYVDPLGATTLAHSVLPATSGFQPYSPHRGDVVVEVIDLDLDLDLDADANPASGSDGKPGSGPGSEPHKR